MKKRLRFLDRGVLRRVLSFALALVMLLSLASGLSGTLTAKAADSLSPRVNDLVQLKVGDTLTTMILYKGGTYEAPVSVSAGSTTAVLVVNGLETDLTVTLTASEDCTIPVRYRNGSLSTIETRKTAALAGSFSNDGTNVRFLADDGSTFSLGWIPEDPNGELNYLGGGIFARTFQISDLSSDTYVEFKITFDDSWSDALGYYGNNMSCTIPAGTTTFTLLVDALNFTCYDSINSQNFTVPQNGGKPNVSKPALTTAISLIGTARCSDTENWDASATGYEFAQYTDTLFCYQATLDASDTPYMYKCVFDYSTWYEAESDNRTISLTEQTRVVFVYDTSTGLLYDSVNNPAKVAELLNTQAPPAKMQVVDNADGTTTFIAAADDGKSVTLCYCDRATPDEVTSVWLGYSNGGTARSGNLFLGDDALDMLYWYEIDGVRTLDGSNPIVIVGSTDYSHYTREAFTGRTITVPGSFPGPSWDETSNVMTYEGNGRYTYTFRDVPVATYQYKIAAGTWDENYGANGAFDGANITVCVPAVQDVTIYYNDFSHRSVCSVDYIVADATLTGTGIPAGTKLADEYLTGIYTVTVPMSAGTYTDLRITCGGKTYAFASVEVAEAKDVTFYLDPVTGIYYCNASDISLDTEHIYFDSKNSEYKSVFGAVATGESVTFAIDTGVDAISVTLVVKGMNACSLPMEKQGAAVNGVQKWAVTTSFANLSENSYYFAISNGSMVKVYGDDDGCYGTGKVTDLSSVWAYDLVVYQSGFETPDWMKNAVVYQIFPDRFFDGAECNNFAQLTARGEVNYEYITDWYTLPENPDQEAMLSEEAYKATGAFYGDGEWANEMYGGDFKGIVERIDYLKALGVNVIYLNPVFSSISNHRYDACDYTKIDPLLGTMGSFDELVKVAEENDMHIILDGVFNHVSDDSIYFDRYYKFLGTSEKIGAYPYWAYVYDYMAENEADQSTAEAAAKEYFTAEYGITDYAYTEWFGVNNTPLIDRDTNEPVVDSIGKRAGKAVYGYEGWWGYDSMPVILSTNGSEYQTGNWAEEIIYNEDGSSVTQFWLSQGSDGWRLDVADEVSTETWREFRKSVKALNSDAVIVGEIWTDATGYLLGDMYDSVMNYMFRGAVTSFAMGGTAADSTKTLERLRERYPEEALYAMMNLVGSHDTTRVLSYLDGIPDNRDDTSVDATFPTYEKTSELAKQRQYLTAFLQFTYAGAPTIYYGDEIGMVGADDPDDRRCFTWGKGNEDIVTWYATLAAIRAQYPALRTGSVEPFTVNDNTMAYVRRDDNDTIIVLASNSQSAQQITLKPADFGISAAALTDAVSGTAYPVAADGTITVTIPALRGVILTEHVKSVTVDKENLKPAYDPAYIVEARDAEPTLTHNEITVEVTPATCTEPGQNKIICADCGAVINAQEVVPATDHSYSYTDNGDGTHSKTCSLCGDTATEAHTFVDGVCVCGAAEVVAPIEDSSLKFVTTAFTMGAELKFVFIMTSATATKYPTTYVDVVVNGAEGETTVRYNLEDMVQYGAIYRVEFAGIAAKNMGDSFTATIHAEAADGTQYVGISMTASIADQIKTTLRKSTATAAAKTLAVDMLNYGAAAQEYFGYDTEHLVNGDLTAEELAYGTQEVPKVANTMSKTGTGTITIVTPSVTLRSKVTLNMLFNTGKYTGDVSKLSYKVIDAATGDVVFTGTPVQQSGTIYKCVYDDVGAKRMRSNITIGIYDENDELVSQVQTWSVESYIADILGRSTTSDTIRALLENMIKYGDAAAAYLG